MRKFTIFLALLIVSCVAACGHDEPASRPTGYDLAEKYNRHIEGQPTILDVTLPQQLSDADWALKASMNLQAGYDLSPYAGQPVSLIRYQLAEKYYDASLPDTIGTPLHLWVLVKDRTTIGGYVTWDGGTPGILAVNDPNIKTPSAALTQSASGSTVTVKRGQIVTVALPGSGSTGYVWEVAPRTDSVLTKRGEPTFVPDTAQIGAPGIYTFTFEASTIGTTDLSVIYHRPGETGGPALQTFQVTVVVQDTSIPFTTLEIGAVSPHLLSDSEQAYVIRSSAEWVQFWDNLYRNQFPPPPIPSISFPDTAVIAIVDAARPTGGYSLSISSIQATSSGVTVFALQQRPPMSAFVTQAFTQPFHIVTTAPFSGSVRLEVFHSMGTF